MIAIKGKVVLVTGASGGIGAAIVKLLVKEGMIVLGVARRLADLEQISHELKNEKGKFYYLQVDVTNEEDIKQAFIYVKENFGKLHALVNNAAVAKKAPLTDGDTKLWREVVDTNLIGMAIATREAIQIMKEKQIEGSIININSILGHITPIELVRDLNMYTATKFAITAMTEALRQELLTDDVKIRVASVCPGIVTTPMWETSRIESFGGNYLKTVPVLQAEDVAETVMFILTRPTNVDITNITIRPLGEKF